MSEVPPMPGAPPITPPVQLIGQASLTNTGNAGVVVKVTFKWKQVGTKPITKTKTVNLDYGKSKDVDMTVRVGSNEIDLIQAVSYSTDDCSVDASIVSTFGLPQED